MRIILGLLLWIGLAPVYALDVLFVHSYHYGYPWVQAYYNAFTDHLDTSSLLGYQMDTKRLPPEAFQQRADEALALIEATQPKVVVVSDDNALIYVGKPALAQGYHVVFMGVNNNPRLILPLTPKLAGVLERPLFQRSVAELTRIIPDMKKILVLMDDSPTTQAIIETSYNKKLNQIVAGVEVNVKRTSSFGQWQGWVRESKTDRYDLIIMANYAKLEDSQGKHVPLKTTSQWTSKHAQLPVFGFWRFSVGDEKGVGGLVLSGQDQGKQTAKIVNHLLRTGEFAVPRIITPTQGQYLFSKTQLKRWNIELPDFIAKQAEWVK